MSNLVLTIKARQLIIIGDVKIFVDDRKKAGKNKQFRLHIDAPRDLKISRTDLIVPPPQKD